jgi:Flp pilus assembly protein TadD
LIKQLNGWKEQQAHAIQAQTSLQQMEKEVRENPTNFQGAFNLVSTYMQLQQTNRAMQVLDGLLNNTQADVNVVFALVQAFNQLKNYPKLEATLEKLVKVAPDNPEAWYDLAAMKATLGRSPEATQSLRRALELSAQRLARDPKQLDLRAKVIGDPRFSALRQSREFQELLAPK